MAGLFDGEGYITINKNKGSFVPVCGIKMNGLNLIKTISENFGGNFYSVKKYVNRPTTQWSIRGAYQVKNFLLKIEPYLIIKKEQAKLCLELCDTYSIRNSENKWIKKIKLNQKIISLRKEYISKIKEEKLKVA